MIGGGAGAKAESGNSTISDEEKSEEAKQDAQAKQPTASSFTEKKGGDSKEEWTN